MQLLTRFTVIALAGLAAPVAAFADTIFQDSTFATVDYSTAFAFSNDSSNTFSVGQCQSCGNPSGQALTLTINEPDGGAAGPASEFIGLINSNFTYDPATQGAIGSISAAVDKDIFDNVAGTLGNIFRPLIEQGGNFYVAPISGPSLVAPGTTGYNTIAATGLTAADFLEVDTATGVTGTANPDFAGGPMEFGIAQLLGATTVSGTVVNYEFDNLNIDLAPNSVPEPGSLPMLLSGLAAIGGLGWTRRKR